MSAINTVLSDGICNKCSKKVNGNDVCCIICKTKFHAAGCSNDIDICTHSFLNQFKPHVDKVTPKYAARPGNFMFMCDSCMTEFEIKMASKEQSKVDDLEKKVDKLESGLSEIKELLLSNRNQSNTAPSDTEGNAQLMNGVNTQLVNEVDKSWGTLGFSGGQFPRLNTSSTDHNCKTRKDTEVKDVTSALIIPAATDEEENMSQNKIVNKIAVDKKVSITKSFKKKNGDTVIVCNSRETRDSLKGHIENAIPQIEIKSSDNCKYTIVKILTEQNYFLRAYFADENLNDHIKFIDTKPLRNNSELFQATFKISKQLRQHLTKHGDRLIIGIISCKVYDRVYVKRCANCQHFGHYFAQCPCKDEPSCALCGNNHETRSCPTPETSVKKCINCVRNGQENTNHAASSTDCPIFKRELKAYTQSYNAALN